jgi:hypothetical protein
MVGSSPGWFTKNLLGSELGRMESSHGNFVLVDPHKFVLNDG